MKILLIKYRNIGDVLLITPLINNLKLFYPNAQIDIALNKGTEDMVTLNPDISRVFIYDRKYVKSQNFVSRISKECLFFFSVRKNNYEILINLTEGDRGGLITMFSNAPIKIGYKSNNWLLKNTYTHFLPNQKFRHTIETNLDPLKSLGIPVKNKKVNIYWSQKDDEMINKKLLGIDQFIHIHPVSRWLFKCIEDKIMAKIIDFCEQVLGFKVILTADSNKFEIEKINRIINHCYSKPINLSGRLTLKEMAALNKRAKVFIGVDTAIMHISAANNVPVFAFFGPSGADHWGPWDNNFKMSTYSERNGPQRMGMHRVFSESRACQPCGKDGCNGTKISDCLMSMNIKSIQNDIQELIHEYQ
jgi:heptosyltransferase III